MEQSEKYGLNVWDENDAVDVSQVNENFSILETQSNYEHLLHIEDTFDGQMLEFTTDSDWSDRFYKLLIHIDVTAVGDASTSKLYLYLNNYMGSDDYKGYRIGSTSAISNTCFAYLDANVYAGGRANSTEVTLYLHRANLCGEYLMSSNSGVFSHYCMYLADAGTGDSIYDLESVQLTCNTSEGHPIAIDVWGVKL